MTNGKSSRYRQWLPNNPSKHVIFSSNWLEYPLHVISSIFFVHIFHFFCLGSMKRSREWKKDKGRKWERKWEHLFCSPRSIQSGGKKYLDWIEPEKIGSSRVRASTFWLEPSRANQNFPKNPARAESSQSFVSILAIIGKKTHICQSQSPYWKKIFICQSKTLQSTCFFPLFSSVLWQKWKIFWKRRSRARWLKLGSFEPALARLEPELFRAEPNSNPVLLLMRHLKSPHMYTHTVTLCLSGVVSMLRPARAQRVEQ